MVLLPLPFEGTVSYGCGTAAAPAAILQASAQVELWDDEVDFDLDRLGFHWANELSPFAGETPGDYLQRVFAAARQLRRPGSMVLGDRSPEVWQLAFVLPAFVCTGALAPFAGLDLDYMNACFHFGFYLLVTVLLRVVMGMPPI